MGFYYISFFSWLAFAIYFVIVVSIVTKVCQTSKLSNRWRYGLLTLAFLAPWAEELWIAREFRQLCRKDAGLYVYKTAVVSGFYDDSTGWGVRQLAESSYKFMESRENISGDFMRTELADDAVRNQALNWEKEKNSQKVRSKNEYLVRQIGDREQIIVSPDGVNAWRRIKIDKPTARYHYTRDLYGVPIGHKIKKSEARITDVATGEILGRHTSYSRSAYWFFIGLDAPGVGCDGPDLGPQTKHSSLIYSEILKTKQ